MSEDSHDQDGQNQDAESADGPLHEIHLGLFTDLVGEKFHLIETEHELELLEASGSPVPKLNREPFSLVFIGPENLIVEQAIYSLDHPKLGRIDLFLVPLSPTRCEAVFT